MASCDSEERRRHPSDVHEAEEQQLRFLRITGVKMNMLTSVLEKPMLTS